MCNFLFIFLFFFLILGWKNDIWQIFMKFTYAPNWFKSAWSEWNLGHFISGSHLLTRHWQRFSYESPDSQFNFCGSPSIIHCWLYYRKPTSVMLVQLYCIKWVPVFSTLMLFSPNWNDLLSMLRRRDWEQCAKNNH